MWKLPATPYHLDVFDDEDLCVFANGLKKLYKSNDYAIMLAVGCNYFEGGTRLRGMENFLTDIYLSRKGTNRLLDRLFEKHIRFLERIILRVAESVQILMFGGDDLGTQNAPFISRDVFKSLFKPYYKKIWDYVKNTSSAKIFLHSCGSIFELMPELIDTGLDILNPVQTTANLMDATIVKKEFGKDITFWGGGVNARDILPFKSPKEIKEDVKRRIDIFAKIPDLYFPLFIIF